MGPRLTEGVDERCCYYSYGFTAPHAPFVGTCESHRKRASASIDSQVKQSAPRTRAVLDDVPPTEEATEEITERLRRHLLRLVNVAVASGAERDPVAARLIEQARTLRGEDLPGDHWAAVGHLRRLGWTANELLERLVAVRCLKEAE
ncbi:DUF6415 family natural product biosynthesis protein [Streptomyces massasporeus]|uniref:DUF6415 family natural product biosynthesis protein n=1 Tax=Streptomyces massasporeus TaxID=67324 RepID=UPI0037AE20C2